MRTGQLAETLQMDHIWEINLISWNAIGMRPMTKHDKGRTIILIIDSHKNRKSRDNMY